MQGTEKVITMVTLKRAFSLALLMTTLSCQVTARERLSPDAKIKVTVEQNDARTRATDNLFDLNNHLKGDETVLTEKFLEQSKEGHKYSVLYEKINSITLSKSDYKITSFIDFKPYRSLFHNATKQIEALATFIDRYLKMDRFPPLG